MRSAGLLMKSGWDVLDWPYIRRLRQLPNTSVGVMVSSIVHCVMMQELAEHCSYK
jgi:hypothetical protein